MLLRIIIRYGFGCPTYYHIKEDKLDPRARKCVLIGFKKGVKGYKIWDPNDRKFILSSDVTFDEASMVKPTNSQQVESQDGQQDIAVGGEWCYFTVSKKISIIQVTPSLIQGDDQVAENIDNDGDQGQAMGNIQESIAVGRTHRNPRKPSWLTTNMIVAYALLVVKELIPST